MLNQKVYVSTTVAKQHWSRQNVYLTGLTVTKRGDAHEQTLISFFEALNASKLISSPWKSDESNLCRNLLPPLLTLYKYKTVKDQNKLKETIQTIAKRTGQDKIVNDILKKYG